MGNRQTTDASRWPWPQAKDLIDATSIFERPSLFAEALSKTLPITAGTNRILDIGCGSGIVGLHCLIHRQAHFVTFNDLQVEAIVEASANVNRHVEANTIRDSQVGYEPGRFQCISASVIAQHSLLAFNPPQLPTDHITPKYRATVEADTRKSLFRLAGPDGLTIAREFFCWYAHLPAPKPKAVILLSSFLGWDRIENAVRSQGLSPNILCETIVPLREQLVPAAEIFTEAELNNRSLRKSRDTWRKKLFTISLESVSTGKSTT